MTKENGVTIIAGGFYGDEGKGKIIGYLASKDNPHLVVRVGGGPQAGHTVTEGKTVTQIPSGFISLSSRLLIGRGTVINPEIVLREIKENNVEKRIGIDYGCTVINKEHIEREKELVARIGSVGTGTGPARVDRVLRKVKLAKEVEELRPYLTDVSKEVNDALGAGKKVLVEGVQGYGLSLMNHEFYPYVTSQDTTASQFASDIGIGPKAVKEVVVVYKSYVSRVGKGPINFQWTEEEAEKKGISEKGTVSGRPRRFGDFNKDLAERSLIGNTGTQIAITCIDRLFKGNRGVKEFDQLTKEAREFVEEIERHLEKKSPYLKGITLVSTGPNSEDIIDLRKEG